MPLRAVRGEESGRESDIIAVNSHNDAEDKGLPAVDRGIVGVFGHEPDHVLFKLKPFYGGLVVDESHDDFPVLRLSDADTEALARSMEEISRHILRPGNYQEDILHHLLHTCLLQVLELIEGQTPTRPAALTHAEVLFQRFITLLTHHYKEEHCIAFYANSLSVSTTYLSRVIRQTTQKTAGYFITGLLYAEACRLLLHTDLSIQAIADRLHFSDQSAFGKFFKANAGLSPQQFRTNGQRSEACSSPQAEQPPVPTTKN